MMSCTTHALINIKAAGRPMPTLVNYHRAITGVVMKLSKIILTCSVAFTIAGCTTIATKTNVLSDERIKSETAGVLGYSPSDLTILDRRTEGVNTFVRLKTKDKKEFNCTINGGNLLSMGVTNPPMCSKKSGAIKTSPFQG
jgi:hypothetical protein